MYNVLTISNTQVCKFANDDGTYRSLIITGLAGVKLKVDDCKIPSSVIQRHLRERERVRVWWETALTEIYPVILLHMTL